MRWRALTAAAAVIVTGVVASCAAEGPGGAPAPRVVISEIHYDDPRPGAEHEFVELVNLGAADVALDGWCLDGFGHCFDDGIRIEAGGRIVVTSEETDGRLADDGERIALLDADGAEVDRKSVV